MICRDHDEDFADCLAALCYENPFGDERAALEARALGDAYTPIAAWTRDADGAPNNPNAVRLEAIAVEKMKTWRARAEAESFKNETERRRYIACAEFVLYAEFADELLRAVPDPDVEGPHAADIFGAFEQRHAVLFAPVAPRLRPPAARLFAFIFQLRFAFQQIFQRIVGTSAAVAALRARVWRSIFGADTLLYRQALHRKMHLLSTLILGPSGTGKELVAQAIAMSLHRTYDAKRKRFSSSGAGFFPVHLAALSPTLIESELFGHKKGAFTGALADRRGVFSLCGPSGAVFLDEIGDVDHTVQVKLLRVLETRGFFPIGTQDEAQFSGKVIAATHQDLEAKMAGQMFRVDLYYRLCADIIDVPSLAQRLGDDPGELDLLVAFLCRRLIGSNEESEGASERATRKVLQYIRAEMPRGYKWPGNVRELDQCLRNVLVGGGYTPLGAPGAPRADASASHAFRDCTFTNDELLVNYTTRAYHRFGSFEETARHLGCDRRTVKARIDDALLARLQRGSAS